MNRITRCPSCATVYQVGSELIEQAHGWLQCGHCQHVFDSTGLVLFWAPAEEASSSPSAEIPASFNPVQIKPAPTEGLQHNKDVATLPSDGQVSADLLSFEQALSSFKPMLDESVPAVQTASNVAAVPTSGGFSSARRVMIVLALLLALIGQLFVFQRQHIAVYWPKAGALVEQACLSMGCAVKPLHDKYRMVIEGSDLVQRGDEHFLSWTVRNTSEHPLGMTALELSLNDAQKTVWLRRVFLPSVVGAPDVLGPGQSWSGELKMGVESEQQISDYRLLSFYP